MSYAQLIKLYFERSNSLQWYWTLYVVIVGGLLAFSSIRKERDRRTALLVMILFCFFAYKNLGAIHDVTEQRLAVLKLIKDTPALLADRVTLEPTLQPPEYEGVRNFHVTSDVLVVLAVGLMERRRWRTKQEVSRVV
jgi:hypothetical protein